MAIRRVARLAALILILVVTSLQAVGESPFRSIGLRLVLPWTGASPLLGIEATANLDPVIGTAAFYLNARGQTLITLGVNLPLGEEGNPLQVSARASTGLAFFDTSAFGPDLLLGIGVGYEVAEYAPWLFGFSVEMIYPIAFPTPVITGFGGYLLP